jgi:hypothetical protein
MEVQSIAEEMAKAESHGRSEKRFTVGKRRSFGTFGVFMAVTTKNAIFWNVTPCGSSENRRFGGACRPHH